MLMNRARSFADPVGLRTPTIVKGSCSFALLGVEPVDRLERVADLQTRLSCNCRPNNATVEVAPAKILAIGKQALAVGKLVLRSSANLLAGLSSCCHGTADRLPSSSTLSSASRPRRKGSRRTCRGSFRQRRKPFDSCLPCNKAQASSTIAGETPRLEFLVVIVRAASPRASQCGIPC